ncbi:MAG: tetratricopeptide repeat protein [Ruminococcaceae bacterium]|nr:tetratricopeptide repeat protein [Oscillospiraceae bacterium]
MFCMNCGSSLPDGTKFCHNCGAPQQAFEAAAPAQQASPAQSEVPAVQPEVPAAQSEVPAAQPEVPAAQPEAPVVPKDKTIELPKVRPPKFIEVSREALKSKQEDPDARITERIEAPPEMPPMMAAPSPQSAPMSAQMPAPMPMSAPRAAQKPKAASTKRNVIILVVVLVLLVAGAVTALFATGTIGSKDPEKILATAERYLDKKDYEQAIIRFEKLLEIDPYNVDAYLGMAEALTALDRADEAKDILEKAADKIKDKDDLKKINEALTEVQPPEESEEQTPPTAESTDTAEAPETTTLPTAPTVEAVPATQEAEQTEDAAQSAEAAETAETTEAATSETAENAAMPENTDTEIIYGDPEILAIEQMLKDHLEGNGTLDTSKLADITRLQMHYSSYISVVCGNKGGTKLDVARVTYSPFDSGFNLKLTDGSSLSYSMHTDIAPYEHDRIANEELALVNYMPDLEYLALTSVCIDDLSPLASLDKLTDLHIACNSAESMDISVLKEIPTIKSLTLSRAYARDHSVIEEMTQLEKLTLGKFNTPDIDFTVLKNLRSLSLAEDDLNNLSQLTWLEELYVDELYEGMDYETASADISALRNMTNLKKLYLYGYASVENVATLTELPQFTSLTLSSCDLTDLSILEVLTDLKELEIIQYDITEEQIAALQTKLPYCKITKGN